MHYVGIDMSKDTFHAAFDDKKVIIFQNTPAGIGDCIAACKAVGLTQTDTTVGVEATGVYHLLLAQLLQKNGWPLIVINPLITSRMIKSTLRRVKTDKTDALAIRKCLMTGAGYRYTDTPEILALKTLVQEREALCRTRAMCKQRQHAHECREKAVGNSLHDSYARTIMAITEEIKAIEHALRNYAKPTQALLRSIPGIGQVTAAALVAYIGDVSRFSSPEKLTAYVGLDCRVHQSGTSIHGKGYISKRGNKYLRCLLFNAAFIAKRRDPILKTYFEKKRAEGKHYFSALCATERKLIHLIYAVWTRGTPFEVRQPIER